MSSQYLVKRRSQGGYDVYMRDLISLGEYRERYLHFTKDCLMSDEDAAIELYHMTQAFYQKNETPATLPMCEQYVFDTIDPGDILLIDNNWFVVQRPVRA